MTQDIPINLIFSIDLIFQWTDRKQVKFCEAFDKKVTK